MLATRVKGPDALRARLALIEAGATVVVPTRIVEPARAPLKVPADTFRLRPVKLVGPVSAEKALADLVWLIVAVPPAVGRVR